MQLLTSYFAIQKAIYEYFGYVEDYVVIPIDDRRDTWWYILDDGQGGGEVQHWEHEENIGQFTDSDGFSDEIYTQRFLPRWVYRGAEYTMICIDTGVDGNKFLAIYDNAKQITDPAMLEIEEE